MDVSGHFLNGAAQKARFNNTYRDGAQSLQGMKLSAEEFVNAHPSAGKMANGTVQSCGGMAYDQPARMDRDPNEFIQIINAAYPRATKAALFRNECGVSYERQPPDVIKEMIRQHAKAGVQAFQNFHGLNDTDRTGPVDRMVQEVGQEEGLDIYSVATICIEADNPNITLESCMDAARKRIEAGCRGFYLKSASGRVEPDFVRDLVGALMDEFPEQAVDVHVHETYGEAIPAYMAAIEAGAARNKSVGVDVLHPAIAGNTAQPDILKVRAAMLSHPDPKVNAMAPEVNMGAIEADMDSLLDLRMRYRDSETKYNPRLLEAMRKAKAPGGASAAVRGIPGLEANLSAVLGTKDWDEIQIVVYEMQAEILPRLGSPTQVTPYALMTTREAAFAVLRKAQGKDPLSDLTGPTVDYLVGRLGKVPETADPELVKMALKKANLEKPVDLSAEIPESGMEIARSKLNKRGITFPTHEDVLIAASVSEPANRDSGVDFVVRKTNGQLKPKKPAPLPFAHLLDMGLNGRTVESLKGVWMTDEKSPGVERKPALGPELLHTLGGPTAFEKLAQAVVTIARASGPLLLAERDVPEYLKKVEKQRQNEAREEIDSFYRAVDNYAAKNGLSQNEAAALNQIIEDMIAGKCAGEIGFGITSHISARRPQQNTESTCEDVAFA